MALQIGELFALISANDGPFRTALNSAERAFHRAGKSISSAGKTLTASVTLPIVGLGVGIIKSAADFEAGMSSVKAVSGATGEEMKQLKELALKMGAETKYSALEATQGMEELIKAGVSTKDILGGGLKGALNLAAAGEIELADAAEIASTVLNSFKSDGLSVGKAADILAGAANASATSVGELKFSLSACSAVASAVGLTFKDTSTALAVFAQNGLKGSDAGTSLKTMLMNLQPSTDKQVGLFKKLGLSAADGSSKFFDAKGKLKGLSDIAGLLQTSMGKLTQAQRLQAMETMFGSDAIRAANILFKEGKKGVTGMASAVDKIKAVDVAAERLNNLNGSMEQLKGSLETAAIAMGTAFLPVLRKITDKLTDLTNKFMKLSPETQRNIVVIAGIAAVIGPLLIVIGSLISAVGTIAGAMSFLAGIFSPVGLAIVAVVVVIGVLIAAVVDLWNTNAEFRKNVKEAWENIQIIIKTICRALKDFWDEWGDEILTILKAAWELIKGAVALAMNEISGTIKLFTGIITGDWDKAWEGIEQIVTGRIKAIVDLVQGAINLIKELMTLQSKQKSMDIKGAKSSSAPTFESIGNKKATLEVPSMLNGFKVQKNNTSKNLLRGFALGTSFAPGGLSLVGELGPELVNLPRGSKVYNNSETNKMLGGGGGQWDINLSGTIKVDTGKGMENLNSKAIEKIVAQCVINNASRFKR